MKNAIRLPMSAFELYRRENPKSRAQSWVTIAQTSSVRTYACVACGAKIASDSARWGRTKAAASACDAHRAECATIRGYKDRAAVALAEHEARGLARDMAVSDA